MNSRKRIVLVTGGAKGIGRAIVKEFSKDSIVIVNCFHSYKEGKKLVTDLQCEGADAHFIWASIEKENQRQSLFEEIEDKYGRLDVLVNNAAYGKFQDISNINIADMRRSYETNVVAALECSRLAHPLLKSHGGGVIVNLSSVGSSLVVDNYLGVGVSKAALESLTRYLASEWSADNIRVNAVSGGFIEGKVADSFPNSSQLQGMTKYSTPFQRLGTPAELARVVKFLADDDSSWITGQTIVVDGGLSLGGSMLAAPEDWISKHSTSDDFYRTKEVKKLFSGDDAFSPKLESSDRDTRDYLRNDGAASGHATMSDENIKLGDTSNSFPKSIDRMGDLSDNEDAIAIVGMGMVAPGASSPEQFWEILSQAESVLSDEDSDRIKSKYFYSSDLKAEDKTYQTASGYADNYTPEQSFMEELGHDIRSSDYTTQWFRHSLIQSLSNVKVGRRVGCAIGYTADGNQHLEEAAVVNGSIFEIDEICKSLNYVWSQEDRDQTREALSNSYNLFKSSGGSAPFPIDVGIEATRSILPPETDIMMIDTACSSSLYALDIMTKGLIEGRYDTAVCGGTFAVGPRNAVLFAKLHGLSRSGTLRPLDKTCDGVLFSDGAASLVLKRYRDAVKDGDPILGFVSSIGTSSDGQGKAIYAPNSKGQILAIDRANSVNQDSTVDWIIAHATGTPAGDLCEMTSIRSSSKSATPTYITSNKSIIGHTGWAAGAISIIQALLSFQHSTILPQANYNEVPVGYNLDSRYFEIPTSPIDWTSGSRPRRAAVSGFGFGGTNAHVFISDRAEATFIKNTDQSIDDIVVVGWGADFPGLTEPDEIVDWILSEKELKQRSFGESYETDKLAIKMPPRTIRSTDRTQLIAVKSAQHIKKEIGGLWEKEAEKIGVIIGHMGPTRNALLYAHRCHVDSVLNSINLWKGDLESIPNFDDLFRSRVRSLISPSSEDSFPGIMPNIIAARVSNIFNTNGPNIVVDVGEASAITALDIAARQLRSGNISIAIAGGVHGNSMELYNYLCKDRWGTRSYTEGGALFAVTRRDYAERHGLPIFATIGNAERFTDDSTAVSKVSFGGAQAAVELLKIILGKRGSGKQIKAHVVPGLISEMEVLRHDDVR